MKMDYEIEVYAIPIGTKIDAIVEGFSKGL